MDLLSIQVTMKLLFPTRCTFCSSALRTTIGNKDFLTEDRHTNITSQLVFLVFYLYLNSVHTCESDVSICYLRGMINLNTIGTSPPVGSSVDCSLLLFELKCYTCHMNVNIRLVINTRNYHRTFILTTQPY